MKACGVEVPGQQLGEPFGWRDRQHGQYVAQGIVGLQAVELDGLDHRIQVCAGRGAPGAAGDHPVLTFMLS